MNARRLGLRRVLVLAGLVAASGAIAATSAIGGSTRPNSDVPPGKLGAPLAKGENNEEGGKALLERDAYFSSLKTAGDRKLDVIEAGKFRAKAAEETLNRKKNAPARKAPTKGGPTTFTGAWTSVGPNPIAQITRSSVSAAAMAGRIGALAIRSDGTWILGGAQGGIWTWDSGDEVWVPRSLDVPSLAIGALAVAPSNDEVVYAGTGEGALSGDSMFGNGVLRSDDGGQTWSHVSGDYFEGVSISRVVVDPTNASHVYAAVLRGRGGARRVTPAEHSRYGIWESTDSGASWTLLKEVDEAHGATDLEIDPQDPDVLWATFWSDGVYKSTDGGHTWTSLTAGFGLPSPDFAAVQTRMSIAVSHPDAEDDPVLYDGFEWVDAGGYHAARVWKSTDGGATWELLPAGDTSGPDHVEDYCGTQCFYDNVIEVDPTNPDVVFAGGNYNYGNGSGGIYRSTDGGETWLDLGWDQHPDFHALAFNPLNTDEVLVGNDGGVWSSETQGGRPSATDPLSAVDWRNLNGTVDPASGAPLARTNLQLGQFTSVATTGRPGTGPRIWGGTQDNGTLRKLTGDPAWFDMYSGDGGQVLVDRGEASTVCPSGFSGPCNIYGTYFGISPYRASDGGAFFFSNAFITNGIDLTDRSEFYIPWTMNQRHPNQLFLGTFRVYRTDNAKAEDAADVLWKPISDDLTSGCTGTAPNGARGCYVSAIGVGGGNAAYVGTLDGLVWVSTDAQTSDDPTWERVGKKKVKGSGHLPNRPVSSFAVDRSNYRIAWIAYNGYNAATKGTPGHVWKTTDGGKSWTNATGNLPDVPVNWLVLDPAWANTLYAATDVGVYVTYDGGANWSPLGTNFPMVTTWQLDMDPAHRLLAAGTHGRGAWQLFDDSGPAPALVLDKVDAGIPVGGGSNLTYTLSLHNIGNADATGVTITDPVPDNTSFVSADNGGAVSTTKKKQQVVTWTGLSVDAGDTLAVHLTVNISSAKRKGLKQIVNDGVVVTSAEGPGATGSPAITTLAKKYAVSLTPTSSVDGARAGDSVDYLLDVKNDGFLTDSYNLSSTGGTYAVTFLDASCSSPQSTTPSVSPGATTQICVRVSVPGGASDGATSTSTVKATSVGDNTVSASATVQTIAVTKDWLLVDGDGNGPDVQSYYTGAMNSAGLDYSVWDLAAHAKAIPQGYLTAHTYVVWFTGNSYPGPITKYEDELQALLDGGGHLFLSGQDILDQAAGTTDFVHDYLHVDWDGSETQNDKATDNVNGVTTTLTDGIGAIPLDTSVLGNAFMDQITPIGGAITIFTDDAAQPDGLSFSGGYQVVFLAFPFEEYGDAGDKSDLMGRVACFFTGC